MRICAVEDDVLLNRAINRFLGCCSDVSVESNSSYENLVPNECIDIYFLDFDNSFGMSGGRWLELYGKNVPVYKRLLTSGFISNWDDFTGVKIVKPYNLSDLEKTLDLMYENNKRYKK